jgi:HTH-like domain
LADKVREFFDASGGTYGSPRITLDLWAAGYRVSENTVARLMAFYNARRRHSACAGMPPTDYEHFIAEARTASAA